MRKEAIKMKFEIRKGNSTTQPYYWRIVASNGNVLASSEMYVNKADARSAAESVKSGAAATTVVDLT